MWKELTAEILKTLSTKYKDSDQEKTWDALNKFNYEIYQKMKKLELKVESQNQLELQNRYKTEVEIIKQDKTQQGKINQKWIFIGMSYAKSLFRREKAIQKAIKDAGFVPKLAKENPQSSNNIIDNKILDMMDKSKFGIFDVSNKNDNYPNIGAIFECGYMMGAKKEVIMICREKDIKKLHFDLRNRDILTFKTNAELENLLKERIQKIMAK